MSNTRTITVVSTKNGRITKFIQNLENFEVTVQASGNTDRTINTSEVIKTWGGLRDILSAEGYDLNNLKPTENINKTTLEHINAVLPDGDFRVFLRPSKTKSGNPYANMGFKDLRAEINKLGENCKTYLSTLVPGKNWTQLTTDQLREGLSNFTSTSSTPASTPVEENAVMEETSNSSQPVTNLEKLTEAKSLLNCVKDNTSCSDLEDYVNEAIDIIDNAIDLINVGECDGEQSSSNNGASAESEEEKAARIAREEAEAARKAEEEEIAREARELEEGF